MNNPFAHIVLHCRLKLCLLGKRGKSFELYWFVSKLFEIEGRILSLPILIFFLSFLSYFAFCLFLLYKNINIRYRPSLIVIVQVEGERD